MAPSPGLKSSHSRGALTGSQQLEYDPFFTNQQRYLAAQEAALNKQNHIYKKHLQDFTMRK